MQKKQSELTVITKAKDLCTYVMTVTQKSPKIQDVFCLNNMSKYPRRVQNVCNILEPGLTVTERDYRYDALSGD